MTHHTPLAAAHSDAGATMTDFAGWRMPLKYGSELAEHAAVRTKAGMFDLSHMGQLVVSGPDAALALDRALVGAIAPLEVGRAKYTLICAPDGSVIDDLIVYRLAEHEFLVIANAANREVVAAELTARGEGLDAALADTTFDRAMIAVQGPLAAGLVLAHLDEADRAQAESLRYYRCLPIRLVTGARGLLARTGYTGEDGFEIMLDAADARPVWDGLAAHGGDGTLTLCGLAARDTLRLEAAMPLYGHELDRSHNPFQAGLGRIIALGKESFVGKDALTAAAAADGQQVLVGLVGEGRRAARAGCAIVHEGREVGVITSGVLSPTLGYPIALGYVEPALSEEGRLLDVDVRGKLLPMKTTPTPFYRRAKS